MEADQPQHTMQAGHPDTVPGPAADPKLSTNQAAAMAGVSPETWRDYTRPRPSRARRAGGPRIGPAPDGRHEGSGWPWWYESTIRAWLDQPRRTRRRAEDP